MPSRPVCFAILSALLAAGCGGSGGGGNGNQVAVPFTATAAPSSAPPLPNATPSAASPTAVAPARIPDLTGNDRTNIRGNPVLISNCNAYDGSNAAGKSAYRTGRHPDFAPNAHAGIRHVHRNDSVKNLRCSLAAYALSATLALAGCSGGGSNGAKLFGHA